jgi:DNA-binding transcriptional MerR regulator
MKKIQENEPFYPTGMAAKLLNITADRLRTYEEEGLIKPFRQASAKTGKRLFSQNDIEWLEIIRKLMKLGISASAIRIFLYYKNNLKTTKLNLSNPKDKEVYLLVQKMYSHPVFEKIFK